MQFKMARRILVDTSAIFAIISSSDEFHSRARHIYTNLLDRGDQLYTTSYILAETSALGHRRLGFEPLKASIQSIQSVWDILWVDRVTHEEVWNRIVKREGSQLSFVDWSTIVVSENTRSAIFAFDQDFQKEGLTVIPASS
jgi:predicted nucleic acid-binding protein